MVVGNNQPWVADRKVPNTAKIISRNCKIRKFMYKSTLYTVFAKL